MSCTAQHPPLNKSWLVHIPSDFWYFWRNTANKTKEIYQHSVFLNGFSVWCNSVKRRVFGFSKAQWRISFDKPFRCYSRSCFTLEQIKIRKPPLLFLLSCKQAIRDALHTASNHTGDLYTQKIWRVHTFFWNPTRKAQAEPAFCESANDVVFTLERLLASSGRTPAPRLLSTCETQQGRLPAWAIALSCFKKDRRAFRSYGDLLHCCCPCFSERWVSIQLEVCAIFLLVIDRQRSVATGVVCRILATWPALSIVLKLYITRTRFCLGRRPAGARQTSVRA